MSKTIRRTKHWSEKMSNFTEADQQHINQQKRRVKAYRVIDRKKRQLADNDTSSTSNGEHQ